MFEKIFKKSKLKKDNQKELPIAPGTNGYVAKFECPYCKKTFAKTSLYCDHCGKQVFDKQFTMKKTFLGFSILFIILGVVAILVSLFFWYAKNNTLDGSFDLYKRQELISIISLITGFVLIGLSIALLCFGKK